MSKKILVNLDMHDGRDKQKAIKAVAALVGIDAISVDLASKKMMVIGMVDPVKVVSKLRKAQYTATIVSIGPANPPPPPEKKEEKKEGEGEKKDEKKDEKKEGEGEKKDEKKDGEGEKKDEKKEEKKPTEQQIIAELLKQYQAYHPYMAPPPPPPPHYYVHSMEENPNSCVIC